MAVAGRCSDGGRREKQKFWVSFDGRVDFDTLPIVPSPLNFAGWGGSLGWLMVVAGGRIGQQHNGGGCKNRKSEK
jgi:hypothetical protein